MTFVERALCVGRALLADESAAWSTYCAVLIGLSASALLIVVRIGTALSASS